MGLARSDQAAARVSELGAEPLLGDVLDRQAVDSAVAEVRPTTIVHQVTALSTPVKNPRKMGPIFEATNRIRTEGTRYLVDAAERYGVQRFIAQSVTFAYRHEGPSVMGTRNVQGVVLRYGAFYGRRPPTARAGRSGSWSSSGGCRSWAEAKGEPPSST